MTSASSTTQPDGIQLDVDAAKRIVHLAIEELKKENNTKVLKEILAECEEEPNHMLQFQLKMGKLIPKVMQILGGQVESVIGTKVESSQIMMYVMQIQALAMGDIHLGVQVSKVMKTLSGDFSGLYEEDEEEEVEQVE